MNEFFRRIWYMLNRRRFDSELADDMAVHHEMAAREGRQSCGNPLQLREQARDAWGWTWIDRLFQDLRYAARKLRRAPGFTLAAILMLAVGIGVNVAAFGFFNLIFLKPLPVSDAATLVHFRHHSPQRYAANLPWPEVAFFRNNTKTLSAVLAVTDGKLAVEGEPNPVIAHFVTASFFRELGAAPMLGRLFDTAREETAGGQAPVVLSQIFWQRRFAADPLLIGRTILLNGKPARVIGVAPREFSGLSLESPDLW